MILGGTRESGGGARTGDEDLETRIAAAKTAMDQAEDRARRYEATARTARDVARRLTKHHDDLVLERDQMTIEDALQTHVQTHPNP